MKARSSLRLLPLLLITVSVSAVTFPGTAAGNGVAATSEYWNPGGIGGTGIWGTSPGDKNWNITAEAPSGNTFWPDTGNEVAVFQDAIGGTATVFTPVQAAGIIQHNADYTIDAETITLVPDVAAANPFIHVQTGTLTINSTLAGSHGLIKTGVGNLVLSNANTYAGTTSLLAGTLTLTGSLASTTLDIAAAAELLDSNGGLAPAAAVTNAGNLTVNAADTVAAYSQNATATLAGGAALTVSGTATLMGGSITGSLLGNTINVTGGTTTNTGTLGTTTTHLDIAANATLVASGTQRYGSLTTSGAGAGTWQGNLTNTTIVAPGGTGATGTLLVTNGDFTNSPGGTLKLDIAQTTHDLLDTTGTATFNGALQLNQIGTAAAPFVPIHVVDAATYAGNFSSLTENLDGTVWFNPDNGDVIRIAVPDGTTTLFGATTNQTAAWIALYDDVIDPGITNIMAIPGGTPGYSITSGIADGNNPDLLWALTASFTPDGLNANLLNHLSPEVYVGLSDYAMQATRAHQRSAFSAPALAPAPLTSGRTGSKGGSKDATPAVKLQWEMFAAADYFNVETSNSQNQADYQLSGFGILAGVRTHLTDRIQLAAYLAGDAGDISGALIDADAAGWSLGLLGEAVLDEKTGTRLSARISYGRYSFDGTRSSVAATSNGWIPAAAGFSDVAADSLEMYVGVESLVYHNEHFRLIPAFGLRAATGAMDSFTESNSSTPGSPIALAVDEDHYTSVLADLSLRAEADVSDKITVWGMLGGSAGIGEDPHSLTASFAKGSRPFQTTADGLSNNSWFLGVGGIYKLSDALRIALGYRAEFRSDADVQSNVCLSSSFRF